VVIGSLFDLTLEKAKGKPEKPKYSYSDKEADPEPERYEVARAKLRVQECLYGTGAGEMIEVRWVRRKNEDMHTEEERIWFISGTGKGSLGWNVESYWGGTSIPPSNSKAVRQVLEYRYDSKAWIKRHPFLSEYERCIIMDVRWLEFLSIDISEVEARLDSIFSRYTKTWRKRRAGSLLVYQSKNEVPDIGIMYVTREEPRYAVWDLADHIIFRRH
jgi:hypothetical protein